MLLADKVVVVNRFHIGAQRISAFSFFLEALSRMGSMTKKAESRLAAKNECKPQEMALYEESYCRLRVLIIADESDAEFERCTLQVVEQISLNAMPCAPAVGTQFSYLRRRDIHCHGMARLVRDL